MEYCGGEPRQLRWELDDRLRVDPGREVPRVYTASGYKLHLILLISSTPTSQHQPASASIDPSARLPFIKPASAISSQLHKYQHPIESKSSPLGSSGLVHTLQTIPKLVITASSISIQPPSLDSKTWTPLSSSCSGSPYSHPVAIAPA